MIAMVGLSGLARSGKDTIADYLVKQHGFVKFSFSDALYYEVSEAFEVPVSFLHDAATKDTPSDLMSLFRCRVPEFHQMCLNEELVPHSFSMVSPRKILQWWGTEFRRKQDPDYWIKKAAEWYEYAAPARAVNTSVRFNNEAAWIRNYGGAVWRVSRVDRMANDNPVHISEAPLILFPGEAEISNHGTLACLYGMVEAALAQNPVERIPLVFLGSAA
jgi:hypothetical protein